MNVPAFVKPVLLIGRENMNRSVEGDVVAVEIFPESEWKAPGDEVVDADSQYSDKYIVVSSMCLMLFLSSRFARRRRGQIRRR